MDTKNKYFLKICIFYWYTKSLNTLVNLYDNIYPAVESDHARKAALWERAALHPWAAVMPDYYQ